MKCQGASYGIGWHVKDRKEAIARIILFHASKAGEAPTEKRIVPDDGLSATCIAKTTLQVHRADNIGEQKNFKDGFRTIGWILGHCVHSGSIHALEVNAE